jgi:hypothetical protein
VIALCASGTDAARPPNFVIIFIDDMGWRDWSGNGSDYLETPNIDKIGKEGLVFDQGYLNAALSVGTSSAIEYVTLREDAYSIQTCTYSGS